ncbi:2Fe-2S iron-sulfur cluster-binding protein [Palleronia sp. LCG004]|uniref:2Fe-2S iron-sulfur cluster-binding protein n=1 Tax=Palleronia sp. LCG004 TaxID=3079304 RepID=UPI002941EE4D|nr:2Fe-2S iron-sulfur cluster-binding protein [Palleronia sp. LCG004]WOI55749.1 2Fe-2S iron-sulfur cluster-binding protein [Palleronia sp. LCG004]
MKLTLNVNGEDRDLDIDPRTTLLDALRNHLELTGSKKGCDHGQCGACTILLNGRRINACLTLAVMHEGDEILTIEGVGQPGSLSPLQRAFVQNDGYQCGYCTPGQIMSAKGMMAEFDLGWPSNVSDDLTAVPDFSRTEIRERMSGNLCRCSAYPGICAAIEEAAPEERNTGTEAAE